MSAHIRSVSQEVMVWASSKVKTAILIRCWLGSAEAQGFLGKKYVHSTAGQKFVVMCGAKKFI